MVTILDIDEKHRKVSIEPELKELPLLNKVSKSKFKLDLVFKEWKRRDSECTQKVQELQKEIDALDNLRLDYHEKCAARRIIERTDGHFKLESYIKFVTTIEQHHKNLPIDKWHNTIVRSLDPKTGLYAEKLREDIPVFWNKEDGDRWSAGPDYPHYVDQRKILERCDEFEKLFYEKDEKGRYKYARRIPTRSYELRAHWVYKNDKGRQAFLKEADKRGLLLNAEPLEEKEEVYDFVGGFYYKIPFRKEKLPAEFYKQPTNKKERDRIKRFRYSQLGTAEDPFDKSLLNRSSK